ncbi:MAG: ribbon-helix-helix protein, CopG family [Acidobacteriota bacterium]
MDKVFSARLDETAIDELSRCARQLGLSKKQFLEEAIHLRAGQAGAAAGPDVWAETAGAWKRGEPVAATIRKARNEFRSTFLRHHRGKHARLHR